MFKMLFFFIGNIFCVELIKDKIFRFCALKGSRKWYSNQTNGFKLLQLQPDEPIVRIVGSHITMVYQKLCE